MKKQFAVVVFSFVASLAFAGIETVTYTLPADYSTAKIVPSGTAGYVAIGDVEGLSFPYEPAGAPMLPETSVQLKAPKNGKLLDVTYEATWKTIASEVSLLPIQPPYPQPMPKPPFVEPNVAQYAATWPMAQIEDFGVQMAAGQALLPVRVIPFRHTAGTIEAATSFTVKARFLVPEQTMALTREDITPEEYKKQLGSDQPDYILIAPNMYYSVWSEYVEERKTDHPELKFLCKNFSEILNDFPVNTTDSTLGYYARNDAERLHAYIRQEAKKGTHYFVLAGSWYDAHGCPKNGVVTNERKQITITTPEAQYVAGPDNSLPGIYTIPRSDSSYASDMSPIPSDLFYACCDIPEGTKYPWDAGSNATYMENGDGLYCNEPTMYGDGHNGIDVMPDVVVTRIPIKCGLSWRDDQANWTYRKEVERYLAKVRKAESENFAGRGRYTGAAEKFGGMVEVADNRTIRDELSFYTGSYNLFDPRHQTTWPDCEHAIEQFMRDYIVKYTPTVCNEEITNTNWPLTSDGRPDAIERMNSEDWEFALLASHGSQGGSTARTWYNETSQKMTGLVKVHAAIFPCLTGYPDWTGQGKGNESGYNHNSHCDSLIENPDGGAAFCMGNSRNGWGGNIILTLPNSDGLSTSIAIHYMEAYFRDRLGAGDAYLAAQQRYSGRLNWGTGRWVWACLMAYGDPLPNPQHFENKTWEGEKTGTHAWDYYLPDNVSITTEGDFTFDVGNRAAAMRLDIHQPNDATFALTSSNGEGVMRVSTNICLNAGIFKAELEGGVGYWRGLEFTEEKGNVILAGDKKFYIAKMKNVDTVTIAGSNQLLDFRRGKAVANDDTPNDEDWLQFDHIVFDTSASQGRMTGNILRGNAAGVLARFLPLVIEGHDLRIETFNAFEGATVETFGTIKDSTLTFGANPNYGRPYAETFETIELPFTLDNGNLCVDWTDAFALGRDGNSELTIEVKGDSRLSNEHNGKFVLNGTVIANLANGATLTILCDLISRNNGKLVIQGNGTLIAKEAKSVSGEVVVKAGSTIQLTKLPLAEVTKLTLEEGAKVILPESTSGTYQITPLLGAQLINNGALFYNGSLENPIEGGRVGENGTFYDPNKVLTWKGANEAEWSTSAPNWSYDGVDSVFIPNTGAIFNDLDGNRTILVNGAYDVPFAVFSSPMIKYTLNAATERSKINVGNLSLAGDVDFNLPMVVGGKLEVMGGKTEVKSEASTPAVNTKEVAIYKDAEFGASSLGYSLNEIKYIRFYILSIKNPARMTDKQVGPRMEEIAFSYLDESGVAQSVVKGNVASIKVVGASILNGNADMLWDGYSHSDKAYYQDGYSLMLNATEADMKSESVYIEFTLTNPKPLFDAYGVHTAIWKTGDSGVDWRQPNSFRVDVSTDGENYVTVSRNEQGNIYGNNAKFQGGWISDTSDVERGIRVNLMEREQPTEVTIHNGGALLAEGEVNATIKSEDGAKLKVISNEQLECSKSTTWAWGEAPVIVDVSGLTLSANWQSFITGDLISFNSLYQFEPSDKYATLRYANHTLSVVAGDGMEGPYTRTFNGTESWNANNNGLGWHYYGEDAEGNRIYEPFAKQWSEQVLKQNADVIIDLITDSVVTLDANVVCDTLKAADTNNLCGCKLTIKSDGVHTIDAQTLDFSTFNVGEVVFEPNCGAAHVIAGASTRLVGNGTGLLTVPSGNMVILTRPWQGMIEGEGTIVLDPGNEQVWSDNGIFSLNNKFTIELASGVFALSEGMAYTAPKLIVHEGAKVVSSPTSESWILKNKNVELKGGRLEILADSTGWTNSLEYSKVVGDGTIAYVSDQGTVTALPNIVAASTLKIAIGRGKFDVGEVNVPGITVQNGATFSATSLADSSKIRYVRIYFLKTSSGNKVHLSRIRFARNGTNLNSAFAGASISASQGASGTSGLSLHEWLTEGEPDGWAVMLGIDQGYYLSMSADKMANRELYVTIDFKGNPIDMFTDYRFTTADTGWGGLPIDWDIEVSTDGNEFVQVASERSHATSDNYGGTASRIAPLNVEEGGALLAKGEITAKITLAAGAIIKPVACQTMTLVGDSNLILPKSGKVIIDVSNLTVGVGATVDLIKGKEFTEADLAKFTVLGNETGYRLVLGDDNSLKLTRTHFAPKIIVR